MSKFFHCFFVLLILCITVQSIKAEEIVTQKIGSNELFDEVALPNPQMEEETGGSNVQSAEISENMTLREKLKTVYKLEVDNYNVPEYLFREALTHHCKEESKMDNWHIWGAYNAYNDFSISDEGSVNDKYNSNALNIGFDGFLKDNNGDFRIMMGFPVHSSRNYTQSLFADVFVATNKIPHHRIQIGHFRPQIGMEGGNSSYTLAFLGRSQIARNFGTARRLGGRIKGDYSFIDYDLGLYSSGTYFEEFFPGAEFVGWVNVKPLAKLDKNKYGQLKIGGGIDGGRRSDNFFVTGAYIGYEYKKFMGKR